MRASRGVLSQRGPRALGPWLRGLLCLAAIGCGGLPAIPSQGGPRWLSLTSEHFVLLTDARDGRARELSASLERQLHALCQLGFSCSGELRVKLRVIALANRGQFERIYGPLYNSISAQELLFEPLIVLSEGNATDNLVALNRTLAVYLASQAMGPLPAWLARGLGAYFESARYDTDGAFVLGGVPRQHALWLHRHRRIPVAQLLDPNTGANANVITPSAWLLVHYLMSERGSDFAAFQAAVASGRGLSESFHEAFHDLSPERLDALLDRYAEDGYFTTFSKHVTAKPSEPQISALSDADVYELRAEMAAVCEDCGDDRAREVDENIARALASDPTHLRASALSAQRAPSPGSAQLQQAEQLVRAHPDAALAYVQLAMLRDQANAPDRCAPELIARLESLAPYSAYALSLRARCAHAAGQAQSALALSKRALSLAPNNQRLSLAHAQLLYAQHACSELAALLERIRSNATDASVATRLDALTRCEAADQADQAQKTPAREP